MKWYDEKNYHSIGMSIKNGQGFESTFNPYSTTRWAPLQGYILAGIYSISGESPQTARFIQILLSLVLCYLIFWIGCNCFNYSVGLISLFIFTFHPIFIFTANLIYPESNFTLLLAVIFVFFLLGTRTQKTGYFLLTGVFWGLAILHKPVAIFIAPVFPVVLFFDSKYNIMKSVYYYALTGIIAVLVISPWIFHNYQKYDKIYFITTEGAHSLISGNNPYFTMEDRKKSELPDEMLAKFDSLSEEEKVEQYTNESINFILTQPHIFLKNYSLRFINFWRFYPDTISKNKFTTRRNTIISALFYGMLIPLSFLGMIIGLKKWKQNILFYGFVLSFAFGYSLFLTTIRYRLPVEPYMVIFAALGIQFLIGKIFKDRSDGVME